MLCGVTLCPYPSPPPPHPRLAASPAPAGACAPMPQVTCASAPTCRFPGDNVPLTGCSAGPGITLVYFAPAPTVAAVCPDAGTTIPVMVRPAIDGSACVYNRTFAFNLTSEEGWGGWSVILGVGGSEKHQQLTHAIGRVHTHASVAPRFCPPRRPPPPFASVPPPQPRALCRPSTAPCRRAPRPTRWSR